MYRPVMLMGSDHQNTTQASPRFESQESNKPEPTTKTGSGSRGKSRKSAKPRRPNPRQRGVGVAQLERLRLQRGGAVVTTRLNKPQILPHPQPQTQAVQNVTVLPDHHQQWQFQYSETRPDPLHSVPVLYGSFNYDGAMTCGGGSGLVGFDRTGLYVQTVNGCGGSSGFGNYGYNVGLHNDVGGLVMEPNQYGVVGAGGVDHQNRGAAYHEISNEVSSVPKMKQQQQQPSASASSQCCCCCQQKKRFSCGNNMDFGEFSAVFPVVNSSDLPGFDPQNTPNVRLARENGSGFSGGTTYLSSRPCVVDESVEVRAVHRKGRQAGGDIMMEYQFFPDHNNNSSSLVSSGTFSMEHEVVASSTNSSSVGRSSEASDQHLGAACIEGADMMMMMTSSGYSPVDLSLKLSF